MKLNVHYNYGMFSTKKCTKILLRLAVTVCNSFEGNPQDNTEVLLEIRKDVTELKNEFQHFKRKIEEQQSEMLGILKKIKSSQETDNFDIGNSPHTV